MSVKLLISKLTKIDLDSISKDLTYKPRPSQYCPNPESVYLYCVNEDGIYVPTLYGMKEKYNHARCHILEHPKTSLEFAYSLYTAESDPQKRKRDQDVLVKEAIKLLDKNGVVFLDCHTGYGKTTIASYLICHYKVKTAILCHMDIIKEQFAEGIQKCVGNKAIIQIISGKKPINPEADIYIIGIQKILSYKRDQWKHIGMVVVDEAHMAAETTYSKAILTFSEAPLKIGLSATPDKCAKELLEPHHGNNIIKRVEKKDFTVVRKWTNFEPNIEYMTYRGQLIIKWTEITNSLASNRKINEDVVACAISYPDDKIMIMCDRKYAVNEIYEILKNKGEDVDYFCGSKKQYDKSCRIVVLGAKKGGVGLDDPSRTMFIVACDTKDIRQGEGRVRMTNNRVVDYRHNHPTLDKHGELRDKWYAERGATFIDEGLARSPIPKMNKNGKFVNRKTKKELPPQFLKTA